MIYIYFRRHGAVRWLHLTARTETEAEYIRSGLLAEGYEIA